MSDTGLPHSAADYWSSFQKAVCRVCLDQADSGECGLPAARRCALKEHLPQVLETAHRVHSPRVSDYEDALREAVCSRCSDQDAQGHCASRDRAECALHAYLSLVLDAIDEVDAPAGADAR